MAAYSNAITPSKPGPWTIEMWTDDNGHCPFRSSVSKLDQYEQAVVLACVDHVLKPLGKDVASSEWGKALGRGLYELRIRRSLYAIRTWGVTDPPPPADERSTQEVLLRLFFTVFGDRLVLLFHGYDKGGDPSEKRQDREIAAARKHVTAWKEQRRRKSSG